MLIAPVPVEIQDVPLKIPVEWVDSLEPGLKIGYALGNLQVDSTGTSGVSRRTFENPG